LFVGLGAPKQEEWIAANHQKIGVPISVGIGVSFELVGGVVKRAPKWMQKSGLEWFYRLLVEPQRLFKRTVIVGIVFIWLFLKQKFNSLKFKENYY
jgi:N-acetylglucosaminyldiphosphoundecaprenol N-acetyl-beta-D-mannosaminyltransferase